jgi:lipopolysaccharide/colanic/teichoic acid biosynthesis glycosyltransferase
VISPGAGRNVDGARSDGVDAGGVDRGGMDRGGAQAAGGPAVGRRPGEPVKRLVDVVVAALVLALASPVLLVAGTLVRLRLGSPVLFVQRRTGRGLRHFLLFKLRTMTDARDARGALLPDHDRSSRLGQALRRFSIDELPQLINVLRGEMSLVGPRPLLPRYDRFYAGDELLRFAMRPGITGLAQVAGRNGVGWDERLALDARYVARWSLWLDARIILRTVGRVFATSGVSADPAGEMLDLDQERGMSRL